MKMTIAPTATVDTVGGGTTTARIWEGTTDGGVPVKAWVIVVQAQTADERLLAEFAQGLKEVPASRNLTSFDLRMA